MKFQFPVQDSDFKRSMWTGKHSKCVEVATKPEGVAVRDSKNPTGAILYFDHEEFTAFKQGVKDGEFDSPFDKLPG